MGLKKKIVIYLVALVCILGLLSWQQNNAISVSDYEMASSEVPAGFDGYRIVQLSDLHNKSFGANQARLVAKVVKLNPDIIVITGDIVDARRFDPEPALILVEQLQTLAQVYYVNGNHESDVPTYPELEQNMIKLGVSVLRNKREVLFDGQEKVAIIGIDDPTFMTNSEFNKHLNSLSEDCEEFKILLSHRPERFEDYADQGYDLIFSGHAHGGQIRLPFVGGVIAPHQGFFPTYDAGEFELEGAKLIVNRGLGNSLFPQRIFNTPEIVLMVLKHIE